MKFCFSLAFAVLMAINCYSQKGMTVVGIQYKPIFPVDFLGTGKIVNDTAGVQFETSLSSGFNAGLLVRHNFTNLLAFETGICYVLRNYSLKITDGSFIHDSKIRSVSYEIPALLMVYAQTGEKFYVNGSMGPVLDIFPSNLQVQDDYVNHVCFLYHTVVPAVAVNIGCEYRTEKSGNFYLGASFQRPFSGIYYSEAGYYGNGKSVVVGNNLNGSYLTIDLRYFFPQTKTKIAD